MQNKLLLAIFDNNNTSSLHLLLFPSIYSFQCSSFPIMTQIPDVIILMLVLFNISGAYNLYLGLTRNFVLLGCEKYLYFGLASKVLSTNYTILIISLQDLFKMPSCQMFVEWCLSYSINCPCSQVFLYGTLDRLQFFTTKYKQSFLNISTVAHKRSYNWTCMFDVMQKRLSILQ